MSDNFNKSRILKNSLLLYVRMLFTMWLNLYTTRLVLTNLGVEDMGVYGVVGSITTLFTVFLSGITSAIQRFITFELGKKEGNINNVFCTSLNVLFIAAIILFILLEVVGVWILNNKINIPKNATNAAFYVFQLSIFTCIVNLISIPYNALIIAHEKMNAFAIISIIQVVLTCVSAYYLSAFETNRLFIYALSMTIISLLIRLIYQIYCHLKFRETKYRLLIDKTLFSEISKYAGISTTSSILQLIANQGITFVINWTFGVAINAVYNIALQLKNSILSFSLNLLKAISPQITKTYASGELDAHKKLVYTGSKMEVFLIYIIMIPFLFKTEYIMKLWLGNTPEYTVAFVQCIVFISLTYSAFEPIRTSVLATGRITNFMIIPDSFYILVLPISYIVNKVFNNPSYMIATVVLMDITTCILRIYLASKVTIIKNIEFSKKVIFPCFKVGSISSILCYLLSKIISDNIIGLLILVLTNFVLLLILVYFLGINNQEKLYINKIIKKYIGNYVQRKKNRVI